ncbi:MAG: hypothetical protein KKE02_10710 [Alphaproteobacteria bacterium]|nr:hypothetical protein [Alphaproteobacteria bacterium]MBU1515906.1 hypothetical protein [Alphaproteobacteria bacterium]MBU2094128.1 hypothetical protein [Alphaproteobacteria bacterium]MBU2151480.1 hypothetical protein [Alphaproteobacteria bacterium]MBU2305244.1 hypothetical protein [Alphaproteobacteria bacterium]
MKRPDRARSEAIYKEIFSALGVDAMALMGAHLYVEREIEHALGVLLPNPEPILASDLSFAMKARLLRALWPQKDNLDRLVEILSLLNRARNTVAHSASKTKLEIALEALFGPFRNIDGFPLQTTSRLHYIGGYIAGQLSLAEILNNLSIKDRAATLPRRSTLLRQLDAGRSAGAARKQEIGR